jgi:hypothetical protein
MAGEFIGKPKGTTPQHKSVKQAFLDVFQRLGGVDGMLQWATASDDNLTEFYRMYSRMLPRNVDLSSEQPIQIVVSRYGEDTALPSPAIHRVTATNSNIHKLVDNSNAYDEYEKLAQDIDTPNALENHSQVAQPIVKTLTYND